MNAARAVLADTLLLLVLLCLGFAALCAIADYLERRWPR
jgi:hypothetical protein